MHGNTSSEPSTVSCSAWIRARGDHKTMKSQDYTTAS